MQRYYFHLSCPDGRVEDKAGELLSGIKEAITVARQTALELSRNVDYATLADMSMPVRDTDGNLVFEFALADSLHFEAQGSSESGGSRFHH
jgi:hypothetical protein